MDTSSSASSAALVYSDGTVIADRHVDGRGHAEALAPLIAALADPLPSLSLIAVGVGPGPYTGLRVGIATANAIGLALGVRVVGVCSLDAIAAAHAGDGSCVVTSDARRREVYWAAYEGGVRVLGPHVGTLDSLPSQVSTWQVIQGEVPDPVVIAGLAVAWQDSPVRGVAPTDLARHGDDDGGTARALAGATLLEPRPLYVRRADAAEPAHGSPTQGSR